MYSTVIQAQKTTIEIEGQKRMHGVNYVVGVDVGRSDPWCWYSYRNAVSIDGLVSHAVDLWIAHSRK